MSDARWLDVEADITSAARHFRYSCSLYDAGGFEEPDLDGYRAQMAVMHAMQSAHTSVEAGLLRLLKLLDEEAPQGDDWHRMLIERLRRPVNGDRERPAVLSHAVAKDLHETRRFRHLVAHSYGDFDVVRAEPSIRAAQRLIASLPDAIETFKYRADPASGVAKSP